MEDPGIVRLDLESDASTPLERETGGYTGGLALTADKRYVAYSTHTDASMDSVIEVHDVASGARVARVDVPFLISRLVFSRHDRLAAIGEGAGGQLRMFQLER